MSLSVLGLMRGSEEIQGRVFSARQTGLAFGGWHGVIGCLAWHFWIAMIDWWLSVWVFDFCFACVCMCDGLVHFVGVFCLTFGVSPCKKRGGRGI